MESISSKGGQIVKAGAAITGGLVGFTAFLSTTLAKNYGGRSLTLAQQVQAVTARIFGPQLSNTFWQGVPGALGPNDLPQQGINSNLLGFINPTTIAGGVLIILTLAIRRFIGAKYGLKYVTPFMGAIGGGLFAAGIFGGILDPSPTNAGAIGSGAGRLAFPQARTPGFAGAAGLSSPATMGGQFSFNSGTAR